MYAVNESVLSSRAKAVAGPISIHMNGSGGSIRPSVERLAAEASLSRRTVQQGLRDLREAGFLVVEEEGGGRNRTTRYRGAIPPITAHEMHRFSRQNSAGDARYRGGNSASNDQETAHLLRPRASIEDVKKSVKKKRATSGAHNTDVDLGYLDGPNG